MAPIEPEMIAVPAGRLAMGTPACPEDADLVHRWRTGPVVDVGAFMLGKYPVTNREYRSYMAESDAPTPKEMDTEGYRGDDQPVVGISWQDADAYCRWLSEATGKAYRLPRDAEWEYGARGGREGSAFPWGDDHDPSQACYGGLDAPTRVGSYAPNGFGLYDMIGCVWEWCEERYDSVSGGDTATNTPTGGDPAENRSLRGASFLTTDPLNLYVAYRHEDPPDLRHACIGFRVAL